MFVLVMTPMWGGSQNTAEHRVIRRNPDQDHTRVSVAILRRSAVMISRARARLCPGQVSPDRGLCGFCGLCGGVTSSVGPGSRQRALPRTTHSGVVRAQLRSTLPLVCVRSPALRRIHGAEMAAECVLRETVTDRLSTKMFMRTER